MALDYWQRKPFKIQLFMQRCPNIIRVPRMSFWGLCATVTVFFYALLCGFRGDAVGADTAQYIWEFNNALARASHARSLEPLFSSFINVMAYLGSQELFFFITALLASSLIFSGAFPTLGKKYALFVFLWMCYPFFYTVTLNILRQGLSFGVLFAFLMVRTQGVSGRLFFLLVAATIHYASIPFAIILLVARRVGLLPCLAFWFFCLIAGYFNFISSISNLSIFQNDSLRYYAVYLDTLNSTYRTGFRTDFLLFSIAGLIFIMNIFYWHKKVTSIYFLGTINFSLLSKIFLLFNGLGLVFIQMPYSDRFLSWSWYTYPIFIYFYIVQIRPNGLSIFLPAAFFFAIFSVYLNLAI